MMDLKIIQRYQVDDRVAALAGKCIRESEDFDLDFTPFVISQVETARKKFKDLTNRELTVEEAERLSRDSNFANRQARGRGRVGTVVSFFNV